MLKPLTEVLRGSPRPNTRLEWTAEMRSAFQVAKDMLKAHTFLGFTRQRAELALMTDSSADHVGAGQGQPWERLGFFSKKLDPAQTRHSAYDRELLACVSGIRHFRFMLEGRRISYLRPHQGGRALDSPVVPPPQLHL
jgi:hypothetical protein